MSIVKTIADAYIASVKSKDEFRRDTLKLVKSSFMVLDKAPGKPPTEADYINVLSKMVKNLRDNSKAFPGMAKANEAEADIIEEFLPKQLSESDVINLVNKTIGELQLPLMKKNMGAIVKAVVLASNGATDGKTVSTIVNPLLA